MRSHQPAAGNSFPVQLLLEFLKRLERSGHDAQRRRVDGGERQRFAQPLAKFVPPADAPRACRPQEVPCIIRPRRATSARASSSEITPARQAATNSPMLWPAMALGRMPQLIQSCAKAYSIVKMAGCAMTVSVTRRFTSSLASAAG